MMQVTKPINSQKEVALVHGYDTLAGAWNELTRDWSSVEWQSVQRDEVRGTLICVLNLPEMQFTRKMKVNPVTGEVLHMGTAFQCSLPKLLYGKNTQTLPIDDHLDALARADAVVQRWFRGAMPVGEMTPRRIDATDDRLLGDELLVAAALRKLGDVEMPGAREDKRRAWRGQVGTINWPGRSGSHTSKAYSKYLESGNEESLGTLRVERGAIGLKCVRSDYQKALSLAQEQGHLTIGQALGCSGLSKAILGPFPGIVDAVLKEVEEMTVGQLFTKAIAVGLSPARAASLVGYANVIQHFGSYKNTMLTRQGQHNLKKDFEKVGVDPKDVEFGPLYLKHIGPPRHLSPEEIAAAHLKQVEEDEQAARQAGLEAKKRLRKQVREEVAAGDVGLV
jgi:hypothetical protein